MKTALVLGGGGSKGAYEIGVWKALRELDMKFDLVTGTSIGALIGTMVVQDDYEKCFDLWNNLTIDDVIVDGVNFDFDIELLMSQKDRYKTLLQSYLTHKGADISPFEKLLDRMFDHEKFFSSKIDYACMTVNVSKLKPHPFHKEDMANMNPIDAILASASCFPAFPLRLIDKDHYIDGGYYDNVPIELARSKGAEQIVAVDLKSVGTTRVKAPQDDVTYIEPFVPLGSFLLFEHEQIMRNMELGYQDTMKKFNKYLGYVYTFELREQEKIQDMEDVFETFCSEFEFTVGNERLHMLYHMVLEHQLLESLKDLMKYDYPYLRLLEMVAYVFKISDIGIYTLSSFKKALLDTVDNYVPDYDLEIHDDKDEKHLTASLKKLSQNDLVYYFYTRLCDEKDINTTALKTMALLFNDTFMLSLMLYFIKRIYVEDNTKTAV